MSAGRKIKIYVRKNLQESKINNLQTLKFQRNSHIIKYSIYFPPYRFDRDRSTK